MKDSASKTKEIHWIDWVNGMNERKEPSEDEASEESEWAGKKSNIIGEQAVDLTYYFISTKQFLFCLFTESFFG